jgi:hypothetical protein
MAPTIQAGDRLELSPPTSLTVGSIVVFRDDSLLVCHRVTAIDPQGVLSTRGDAAQSSSEFVQPSSVIGVVTGVLRDGAYLPFRQDQPMSSPSTEPAIFKNLARTVVVPSVTRSIRALARFPLFWQMLDILLRWTATIDVLTPVALRSLPSHFKVASFTVRTSPHIAELLAASNERKPARYVVRFGPWRAAQYDPTTASLLLRHSLREAGLESFFRQIFATTQVDRLKGEG